MPVRAESFQHHALQITEFRTGQRTERFVTQRMIRIANERQHAIKVVVYIFGRTNQGFAAERAWLRFIPGNVEQDGQALAVRMFCDHAHGFELQLRIVLAKQAREKVERQLLLSCRQKPQRCNANIRRTFSGREPGEECFCHAQFRHILVVNSRQSRREGLAEADGEFRIGKRCRRERPELAQLFVGDPSGRKDAISIGVRKQRELLPSLAYRAGLLGEQNTDSLLTSPADASYASDSIKLRERDRPVKHEWIGIMEVLQQARQIDLTLQGARLEPDGRWIVSSRNDLASSPTRAARTANARSGGKDFAATVFDRTRVASIDQGRQARAVRGFSSCTVRR